MESENKHVYKSVHLLSDSMGRPVVGLPTLTHFNVRLFMFSVSLGVLYPDGSAVLLLA